ncbi:FtsX-like permease family protein [Flexivirga sp. ID2601S]|uniref:FtsX-like permease family protein n=1 Tax=Flexivirga aerilata TaxID=1656889 RepID=A0A849AHW5_9MICO|nr:FtsX-like permease family protein [Flexivirga aerilata]NNG40045.1 FtsX-like permease family protein [Flexivirga aerilata]
MNVARVAAQNFRTLWRRWFGLTTLLGLSIGLCLAAFSVTDNIAAASNNGILESTANRSIAISRDGAGPEAKVLSPATIDELKRLPGVRSIEPRVQSSFGYKGPGVPGVLLTASTPRPSYLPPLVSSARSHVFPLRTGEVVLPRKADGQDLSSTLGKTISVELTRRVGTNDGEGAQRSVRVVGLFDPSWQLDGQNAAYAAPDTTVEWAALDAGTTPSSYLNSVGYNLVSVVADNADDVPTLLQRIQADGYSATSLQQQFQALPTVLSFVRLMSRVLLAAVAVIALVGAFTLCGALVRHRTREIGICKACGFSSRAVFGIFLGEALLAAIFAAAAGLVIGLLGGALLRGWLRGLPDVAPYLPDRLALPGPATLALLLVVSCAITLLGAALPARRAARLDPVDAIGHL